MYCQIKTRHKILLDAQFTDEEGMADILGVHQQVDFAVDRHCQFGGHDVVLGIRVVSRIQTKEVFG
jgi:hypothetical protein